MRVATVVLECRRCDVVGDTYVPNGERGGAGKGGRHGGRASWCGGDRATGDDVGMARGIGVVQ